MKIAILAIGALAAIGLTPAYAGCVGGSIGDACIGIPTPSAPPPVYYQEPQYVQPPVVEQHYHNDRHVHVERHHHYEDEE